MNGPQRLLVSASVPTLHTCTGPAANAGKALREFAILAENHGVDFVVLQGTADALCAAAWLLAVTQTVGLVPSLDATHTQPFHAARALASMDTLSRGRMGWMPTTAAHAALSPAFGGASALSQTDAAGKAAEYVAVARALWDSWDADALVIDKESSVYLHSAKIRRVDFRGEYFRVMGPLNAARPPQGYPVLVADDADPGFDRAAGLAEVVLIGATGPADTHARIVALRAQGVARVMLKTGAREGGDNAADWARQLIEGRERLGYDGVHLVAGESGTAAARLEVLLPVLERRGAVVAGRSGSLRERLGLALPVNRYSAA